VATRSVKRFPVKFIGEYWQNQMNVDNRVGQKLKKCRVQFPDKPKSMLHTKVIIVPKMDF